MTIELLPYIRQEIDSWYADTEMEGEEPPEPESLDRLAHTLTRWAEDQIQTAICNACL